MLIVHKINMDFAQPGVVPRICAVQGDTDTRAVDLALFDNGMEFAA